MKKLLLRSIGELPRKLGIRLIPDILGNTHLQNVTHLKLRLHGYCQADSYSCGFAAGWSVLEFLNGAADRRRFEEDCASEPVNGTPAYRLKKALRGDASFL